MRGAVASAAALLVLASQFLPLWQSTLFAPQYPDGLYLVAYGDRAEGDLAEIESLNHYIGMRPLRTDELPEMGLWPLGVGVALVCVVAAAVVRGRTTRRLALLYLWGFPLSVLGVIQLRLAQFGHDLDPAAAFRMEPFTPLVVGPTTVWNFTAWSRPGLGWVALVAAAGVSAFGPRMVHRVGWRAGQLTTLMIAVVLAIVPAMPGQAAEGHDHDATSLAELDRPTGVPTVPPAVVVDRSTARDLRAMLAGVPDGGTLTLHAGTYRGGVIIDRPVTVIGHGNPVIIGDGTGTVVTITAPGTIIRGVRVAGSGWGPGGKPAGIRIEADDVTVEGSVVEDSYIGIAVDGADRVRVVGNVIVGRTHVAIGEDSHVADSSHDGHHSGGRGDGLSLWEADDALVRANLVVSARDAVFLSFGSGALIDGNEFRDSRYGIHSMYARELVVFENLIEGNLSAAVLMYGGPATVVRNVLVDNRSPSTGFGLLLKDVIDARVVENVIAENGVGIHLDGPAGGEEPMEIMANTVVKNQVGVALYPSAGATFLANSFAGNVVQVAQHGRGSAENVRWEGRGWGNYWDTYRGYGDGSGRGIVPHVEGSAVDRLLLRAPVLTPLASSPAFRLIRSVEDRWLVRRPVLTDNLPLTEPVSPSVPVRPPEATAGLILGGAGAIATVVAVVGLGLMARRSRAVLV
ncbi:MAG: NosD domain-containing protein [Acidimicrobiia bacterium]